VGKRATVDCGLAPPHTGPCHQGRTQQKEGGELTSSCALTSKKNCERARLPSGTRDEAKGPPSRQGSRPSASLLQWQA